MGGTRRWPNPRGRVGGGWVGEAPEWASAYVLFLYVLPAHSRRARARRGRSAGHKGGCACGRSFVPRLARVHEVEQRLPVALAHVVGLGFGERGVGEEQAFDVAVGGGLEDVLGVGAGEELV